MMSSAILALALSAATPVVGASDPVVVTARDGSAGHLPPSSVVLVWATWCVPCRKELVTFQEMAYSARPLSLVTLALDPAAKAMAALAETGTTPTGAFATTTNPASVITHFGGLPARLPLAFALDANGKVCGVHHGLLGSDQLAEWARTCQR